MYRAMPAKEEPNLCEQGKRLKRAGGLTCRVTRDGRNATCDFSVDLINVRRAAPRVCHAKGLFLCRVLGLLPVFRVFRFFGKPPGEGFVLKFLMAHGLRGATRILACRLAELFSRERP